MRIRSQNAKRREKQETIGLECGRGPKNRAQSSSTENCSRTPEAVGDERGGLSADAEILEYRIDSVYRSGDVIMHAKFDLGFVQRVISEARIEVLFRGSLKLMAMNCKI